MADGGRWITPGVPSRWETGHKSRAAMLALIAWLLASVLLASVPPKHNRAPVYDVGMEV